ncbi:histidine phosphatase family protein [Kribbella amoyensis]|uniref:histidine phosphatase family protein n=1 Tax=Kribbella amoyensis TaxID=996641 RepID=UPI0011A2EADE|nr:histidine phosphatase family protein [Kribbella amoyensis]
MTFGEIIVVRHGESTWNSDRRWAGQADPPLTDLGRKQASELAHQCRGAGVGAVATSDLSRARQTGLIVSDALGLAPPAELPDLRERWSRTLTGLTAGEIEDTFPGALAAWRGGMSTDLPGDSEGFDTFADRVLRGLQAAAGLASVVLVVAHAGIFRVLGAATRTGTTASVANASGRRIVLGADGISDNGPAF